jgi:hypothetical protein
LEEGFMKFLRLHDLNSPDKEVLIDPSFHFSVIPAPAGTGSVLLFAENNQVVYVHESREEIETITAD